MTTTRTANSSLPYYAAVVLQVAAIAALEPNTFHFAASRSYVSADGQLCRR